MNFKICGMSDFENIKTISVLKPNYMGFIFWEKSPRYIKTSIPILPNEIIKTGIFVDASFKYIKKNIDKHNLKAIQLHGKESPGFCSLIKRFDVTVIKAFRVDKSFNFDKIKLYENSSDLFLFDSQGKLPGGNGYNFDWKILRNYKSEKPFFLSGGIGINNMDEIHKLLKSKLPVFGVDVNSKFESDPGIKKFKELKEFKNKLYEL